MIDWTSSQQGEVPVLLRGTLGRPEQAAERRQAAEGEVRMLALPQLEVCGVERQAGDIAVQADPAFDVESHGLRGCQEAELEQVYAWLEPPQRQATRLARALSPAGLPRHVAAHRPQARRDLRNDQQCSHYRPHRRRRPSCSRSRCANAGIRELSFLLPASMANARISVPLLRLMTDEADGQSGPTRRGGFTSNCRTT